MERMTGAEFAAHRHLIGLTLDELADTLGVNPRTTRAWETGRDLIPARIPAELGALVAEHGRLAKQMTDGRPVGITRDKAAPSARPRGWYVAAAARALDGQQTDEWDGISARWTYHPEDGLHLVLRDG